MSHIILSHSQIPRFSLLRIYVKACLTLKDVCILKSAIKRWYKLLSHNNKTFLYASWIKKKSSYALYVNYELLACEISSVGLSTSFIALLNLARGRYLDNV